MCLVILVLLTDKENAYLRIVDHELYLLFRTGGIERDGGGTDAPRAEVGKQILHGVLREDAHVLLRRNAHVKQGKRHGPYLFSKLIPGVRFPFLVAEVLIDERLTLAILFGKVAYEGAQMTVNLHFYFLIIFFPFWIKTFSVCKVTNKCVQNKIKHKVFLFLISLSTDNS